MIALNKNPCECQVKEDGKGLVFTLTKPEPSIERVITTWVLDF